MKAALVKKFQRTSRVIAIRLILVCLGLILFLLASAVYFYPNDQRLPDQLPAIHQVTNGSSEQNGPNQRLALGQSLLAGGLKYEIKHELEHELKDEPKDSSGSVEKTNDTQTFFDGRMTLSSSRFNHPDKISVSLGIYPARVEQHDGLMIPPGATLVVKFPGHNGGRIRFSVASMSLRTALATAINGGIESEWDYRWSMLQKGLDWLGRNHPGLLRSMIKTHVQFLRPAMAASFATGRRWHPFSIQVDPVDVVGVGGIKGAQRRSSGQSSSMQNLTIRCRGESPCMISDVVFYPGSATDQVPSSSLSNSRPENFVVVLVDTLRADAVMMPDSHPVFREFVRRSVSFSRAISPGNMTSPSTNALLSCQTPTAIKDIAFAYAVDEESRESWYRKGFRSFPELMARRGYSTAMIGNISIISEVIGGGVHHGFSQNISIETEGYETALAALEASRWIRSHRDEPFFLYVHLNAPHAPYKAPLADVRRAWRGTTDLASMGDALRWLYRAEVDYSARSFAKILEAIAGSGIEERTHVILLADHGDQHSDRFFSGNESAPKTRGAFFDHGATLLNDEIGVPLVWRAPGVLPMRRDEVISTIGVGPAMLKEAGVSIGNACGVPARKSASILDRALQTAPELNDSGKSSVSAVVGSEGYRGRAVVFDGRWKYIRSHEPTSKTIVRPGAWGSRKLDLFIREELYDLDVDAAESRNLMLARPPFGQRHKNSPKNIGGLIDRARREYDRFYDVRSGRVLVVDNPVGYDVQIPALSHQSTGERRVILPVPDKLATGALRVYVNKAEISLDATIWRLPLTLDKSSGLPRQIAGEAGLMPVSRQSKAYLIRAIENDGEVRRIAVGNPMFDQILREWGYLHDD